MTKAEYRKAIKALKLSIRGSGPVLGVTSRQGVRYAAGSTIPETIVRLLEMYKQHGIPQKWQP
jgi:hypothetical protein